MCSRTKPAATFFSVNRDADQTAIWRNFAGQNAAGNSSFDSGLWFVLYNGQNQTLAVPSPGTFRCARAGLARAPRHRPVRHGRGRSSSSQRLIPSSLGFMM
jgi:hypothetical protein